MVPNRSQIANKLLEVVENKRSYIESWLTSINCPQDDKDKILDDLLTYPQYHAA